jgi:hypothetical protein
MKTLNNVIQSFKAFTESHLQLNTFYSGKEWDFQSQENLYPALISVIVPSTIAPGVVKYKFNIFCIDLVKSDGSNKDEVYSDTSQILGDFIDYFKDNFDIHGFYLDETDVTIEPLEEIMDDVLNGWVMEVTVHIPRSGSTCQIPIEVSI